jgi:hypothetical protein
MGVMLALDRSAPARSRHQGQHARGTDGQGRMDASAGVLRRDAAGPGRYLSRLALTVLASRPALAWPDGQVRTRRRRPRRVDLGLTVSVSCLLGHCGVTGDAPGCQSGGCEHDCHRP